MANSNYTQLGTIANVASGTRVTMNWSNLAPNTQYQWYAVVSNGTKTTTGPTWSFTTAGTATPAVSFSTTNLAFGSQLENTNSVPQNVQLTNSGSALLNIKGITASKDYSQTNTCGTSVAVGGNCTVLVTFRPTVANTDNGTVTISDNAAGGLQTITLVGSGVATAPVVSLSSTSLTFGSQALGTTSKSLMVNLTNQGNAALGITSIVPSGDFADTTTCSSSLAANAACTISVTFTPTATGTRGGAITITDTASGSPQQITLTGTGSGLTAPAVSLSTTSLSFGSSRVRRTSSTKSVKVNNTGNATLSLTNVVASGDFSQTNNCGGSVNAGQSCTISVNFKPTAKGVRTGTITITDNASGSPQTVSLTGTGR
jgi:hypothetical protein